MFALQNYIACYHKMSSSLDESNNNSYDSEEADPSFDAPKCLPTEIAVGNNVVGSVKHLDVAYYKFSLGGVEKLINIK